MSMKKLGKTSKGTKIIGKKKQKQIKKENTKTKEKAKKKESRACKNELYCNITLKTF